MEKKLTIILAGLVLSTAAFAQDVNQRFLDYKQILDFKTYYSKNQTPGLHAKYLGLKVTYIRNLLLMDGDGHDTPDIGLSLNPSINVAEFHYKKEEIRNVLLQEGMLNFTPSLYLSVLPDPVSRFKLFFDITGGVKLFNKLSDITPAAGMDGDDDWGVFDQWVFGLGGGVDFEKTVSVHFNYFRGWHDVTQSTERYYLNYVNTENMSTFVQYFNVVANFRLSNSLYASLEWDGYRQSFNDERIFKVGLGIQPRFSRKYQDGITRPHRSSTATSSGSSTTVDRNSDPEGNDLRQALRSLKRDFRMFKRKLKNNEIITTANKTAIEKDLENMKAELDKILTRQQLKNWLENYQKFKSQYDKANTNSSIDEILRKLGMDPTLPAKVPPKK